MKIPGTTLKYSQKIFSNSCFILSSLLLILLKLQSFKVGDSQKSPPHTHLPLPHPPEYFNIHPHFSVSRQGGRDVPSEEAPFGSDACGGMRQCLSEELRLC